MEPKEQATIHVVGLPLEDGTVRCIRCCEPLVLPHGLWYPGDYVRIGFSVDGKGKPCKRPFQREAK